MRACRLCPIARSPVCEFVCLRVSSSAHLLICSSAHRLVCLYACNLHAHMVVVCASRLHDCSLPRFSRTRADARPCVAAHAHLPAKALAEALARTSRSTLAMSAAAHTYRARLRLLMHLYVRALDARTWMSAMDRCARCWMLDAGCLALNATRMRAHACTCSLDASCSVLVLVLASCLHCCRAHGSMGACVHACMCAIAHITRTRRSLHVGA